jgi:hypothetical protein
MVKVAEVCGISPQSIKKAEPIIALCKEKGNAPLGRCATEALQPILKIKDPKIRRSVITEINQILRQRDDKGDFVKEKLTRSEIVGLITKYYPRSKNKIDLVNPPTFRPNKQQYTLLKRMISLKVVADEREAFSLLFKWAAERIAKGK